MGILKFLKGWFGWEKDQPEPKKVHRITGQYTYQKVEPSRPLTDDEKLDLTALLEEKPKFVEITTLADTLPTYYHRPTDSIVTVDYDGNIVDQFVYKWVKADQTEEQTENE